jgi:hypothetical protein
MLHAVSLLNHRLLTVSGKIPKPSYFENSRRAVLVTEEQFA